ncbi:Cytosolic sulfotransferase 5 [Linum grandiflorum]
MSTTCTSSDQDLNKKEATTTTFWDGVELCKSGGFWYGPAPHMVDSVKAFRANYRPARDDVVVLASMLKAGTTWLKSLSHCILFRDVEEEDDILTHMNPHMCVPTFEATLYMDDPSTVPPIDPERRLFHTHVPYSNLPDSITKDSGGRLSCKFVYVTREPKDTLVSMWHFYNKAIGPFPLERAVESFCNGEMYFGPFYEHVLEYWQESKRSPDKVMFIKYEDLHRDPKQHVRKLASFIGRPFGDGDAEEEEVEKVIWRSSFDRLKDLDVNNKDDVEEGFKLWAPLLKNNCFFRRGKVGDWRNHLTAEMAERIDKLTRMKLQDDQDLKKEVEKSPTLFWDGIEICESDGFWYGPAPQMVDAVRAFRANYQPARDDVVVLATCRLFHTHVTYSNLPDSITKGSGGGCKFVYVVRDPKDTLVSMWHFYNKIFKPFPLDAAVESFCSGALPYGPFYEHVLEYWEESKRSPERVMFIKYEDLRRDPKPHVRKLASFLGSPFGDGDAGEKEVEKVIWRSSFDRLKNLGVNNKDEVEQAFTSWVPLLKNNCFFRRGEVGDWGNHLTAEMAERIDKVTRMKLHRTGLYLENDNEDEVKATTT